MFQANQQIWDAILNGVATSQISDPIKTARDLLEVHRLLDGKSDLPEQPMKPTSDRQRQEEIARQKFEQARQKERVLLVKEAQPASPQQASHPKEIKHLSSDAQHREQPIPETDSDSRQAAEEKELYRQECELRHRVLLLVRLQNEACIDLQQFLQAVERRRQARQKQSAKEN